MELFLADFHSGYFLRVFTACACGLVFGMERQYRAKPLGIRACVLICMGTCLFVYLGQEVLSIAADSTRVIGQVVAGVGFLGAGAILQKDNLVIGMTSAATIWLIAAVGAAIGAGHLGYGLATTLIGVLVLMISRQIEMRVGFLHHKNGHFGSNHTRPQSKKHHE